MNDQITELAELANIFFTVNNKVVTIRRQEVGPEDLSKDVLEKFVESIVKKFDDILLLEQLDCVGNKDKQAQVRVERLREKVKTYFGVE